MKGTLPKINRKVVGQQTGQMDGKPSDGNGRGLIGKFAFTFRRVAVLLNRIVVLSQTVHVAVIGENEAGFTVGLPHQNRRPFGLDHFNPALECFTQSP